MCQCNVSIFQNKPPVVPEQTFRKNTRDKVWAFHPGLAENIAPDGGPGSYIIAVRFHPLDNSWVQEPISLYYDLHSYDVISWAPIGCNILY